MNMYSNFHRQGRDASETYITILEKYWNIGGYIW